MVSLAKTDGTSGPGVIFQQQQISSQINYRHVGLQFKMLSPIQKKKVKRHRKQKIVIKLSDSGFEDLSALTPSPYRTVASPRHPCEPTTTARPLFDWHHHYGAIGYKIQKENEAQFYPSKCLSGQPQVTAEARCKLLSWLIPVYKHFHLSFECCCLAVNIMDRFLASTPVAADCFQLLGVTALLLASKQVEVFSPRITQLLALCCDAFTKEQLCNLECLILLRLNFRLAAPTLAFFLEYNIKCNESAQLMASDTSRVSTNWKIQSSTQCNNLARRICELSLADYAFNKYLPSLTAACALRISMNLLKAGNVFDESIRHVCTQKLIRLGEGKVRTFWSDVSENEHSLTNSTLWQSGPGSLEKDNVAVEDPDLPVNLDGHSPILAKECGENLKLLVSLNQETLQWLSIMSKP